MHNNIILIEILIISGLLFNKLIKREGKVCNSTYLIDSLFYDPAK